MAKLVSIATTTRGPTAVLYAADHLHQEYHLRSTNKLFDVCEQGGEGVGRHPPPRAATQRTVLYCRGDYDILAPHYIKHCIFMSWMGFVHSVEVIYYRHEM